LTVSIKTRTRRANTCFVLEIRVNYEWRKRRGAWISDALGNPNLRPSVGAKGSGLVALFLSCYRKIVDLQLVCVRFCRRDFRFRFVVLPPWGTSVLCWCVSCAPGGRWRRSGQLCRRYQQLLIRKRMWIRKMMARSARLGSWQCGASAPINLVMASKCSATTTLAPTGSKNTSFPAPFPRRLLPSFCCSIILERFFYSSVFSLHGGNLIDMSFRGCNCSDIGADRMAHNRIWWISSFKRKLDSR